MISASTIRFFSSSYLSFYESMSVLWFSNFFSFPTRSIHGRHHSSVSGQLNPLQHHPGDTTAGPIHAHNSRARCPSRVHKQDAARFVQELLPPAQFYVRFSPWVKFSSSSTLIHPNICGLMRIRLHPNKTSSGSSCVRFVSLHST